MLLLHPAAGRAFLAILACACEKLSARRFAEYLSLAQVPQLDGTRREFTFVVPDDLPAGLPAQLLSRRPDLRQAENELHAATAQIGVAIGTRFPYLSLGVTSFFGVVSPELGHLFDSDDPSQNLFSVGPFAELPLFTSGAGQGNVDAARARARQAELSYRRAVLQALREVSNALVASDRVREDPWRFPDGEGGRLLQLLLP